MRRSHPYLVALPILVLALVLAACSGSGPGASSGGDEPSQAAEQSQDQPESQGAEPSSGGGSQGDVQGLADDLVPPNSSQTSQTQSGGTIWTTYESTDSPDSLKSYYENAIAQTGLNVYSTTSAGGSYSWLFAEGDASSFGGSVTVAPSSEGGSGSAVIVLVTDGT